MSRLLRAATLVALSLSAASPALAADPALAARLDSVVQAYANTGRFSGAVLIERNGDLLFDKAYGMANAETGLPNRPSTGFHVGTLSMQYTAVATLHLVETHHLALDNTADQFVSRAPHTTIRDLLAIPPDAPEASADYELLARVVQAAMARSFADIEDAAAFDSVWMSGTGLDDGTASNESRIAKGYARDGENLKPVSADWAALIGAASAYTTTRDELHFLDRFFGDALISTDTRKAMTVSGYGWHHGAPFGPDGWWAAGAAPGFSSFVLRRGGLTVIVLENLDSGPAQTLAADLVAALDK